MKPHHKGLQDRTKKRGADYLNRLAGSVTASVSFEDGDHAERCFASRHREDDNFRLAEALAAASAILHTANESVIQESHKVNKLASLARAASADYRQKWQNEEA